jgi:hypothetical protein
MEAEVHKGMLRGEHPDRKPLPIESMGLLRQSLPREPVVAGHRFQPPVDIHHQRGRGRSLEVEAHPVAFPEPGPVVDTVH